MQVVLLEDVKSLGKKGDVVQVNDGYARNYILPRKLGVEANAKNLNDLKLQKAYAEKLEAGRLDDARKLREKLEADTVEVSVRAGENGKVFGSVSSKEIAAAMKTQFGLDIDKKKIQIQEPIKAIGIYKVPIRLHKDVTATLTVHVSES